MRLKATLALASAMAMLTLFGAALSNTTNSLAVAPAASEFIGTWQTTWKNPDGTMGSAPVTVKADTENANALDGVVEMKGPDGVMYGKSSSEGKTWSGDWWNSKDEKGTFTFTLKDKKSFEGTYTLSGASGNFTWNGTR